ncbi:type IV conjugative transfer system protein TraE [Thiotrichales bacterium 19S11-10]|nr:type IV conjugative transfer system protein TraE [Thiotrichales bacterium 19S11-10]
MDYQSYQGSVHQLKKLNRYLIIALVAMSLSLIAMSFCVYRAIGYKTVTLVPPLLSQQMSISDIRPDRSYVEQMGLFLTSLRLNVTPLNVDKNFHTLLLHVSPKYYGEMELALDQEAKVIKKGDISAVFYPTGQLLNIADSSLTIAGRIDKYVSSRLISSERKNFKLIFDYKDGSLTIDDFFQLEDQKESANA